ncbi:MAG: HD family hydrolase [Candidatus Rifleibacteriota bacterium]
MNTSLDKVFHDFLTLKKIRRTGWQLRGIRDCESLADHCFGVVLLTYLLCDLVKADLNKERAVAISIIHELGECRVGDIPYTALKYFPEKSEIETKAVADILHPLGEKVSKENLELFKEFETGNSLEARFVRAIDKLEMLITAAEYEKAGFSGLTDFWNNESTFSHLEEFPELSEYAKNLKTNRVKRVTGKL